MKIYGHIGFWIAAVAVVLAIASAGTWADEVKAGGASSKAGRAVNDSPAKSEGASNNSGRVPPSIEHDAKSGKAKKQPSAAKAGPGSSGGRNAEAGPIGEGDPRVKTSKAKQ